MPDGLKHHVAHDDPSLAAERNTLESQSHSSDGDDLRIISEQSDQLGSKGETKSADGNTEEVLKQNQKALFTRSYSLAP